MDISTFAVIDLETTNLPAFSKNRVSITELCIYAFDPAILKQNNAIKDPPCGELSPRVPKLLPPLPRVMHKLNLLFQPSMMVSLDAQRITGLDNYILERESKLDQNAGQMIQKFFEHLAAPVCLVAHNGWNFDYPIIKQAFDKLNLELPSSLLCVDSLRAFMEIDDIRFSEQSIQLMKNKLCPESELLSSDEEVDWQAINNTTPKRPTLPHSTAAKRRKLLYNDSDDGEDLKPVSELRSRRQLFRGLKCAQTKRIPIRGRYSLGSLFERTFEQPAADAHQAEADVNMLTKIILHYGVDFLAFAQVQAIPFAHVVALGSTTSNKN